MQWVNRPSGPESVAEAQQWGADVREILGLFNAYESDEISGLPREGSVFGEELLILSGEYGQRVGGNERCEPSANGIEGLLCRRYFQAAEDFDGDGRRRLDDTNKAVSQEFVRKSVREQVCGVSGVCR